MRVNLLHSFNALLTEAAPRMDVPPFDANLLPLLPLEDRQTLSKTSQVITPPLSRKEMREGPVDYHTLTGRWARQLGR